MDKISIKYWKGTITINISLPADVPVCARCKLLSSRFGLSYCIVTEEPIIQPEKNRGKYCPIEWSD